MISEALACRGGKPEQKLLAEQSILAVGENAAALQHCLDEDDQDILTSAVESARKKSTRSQSAPNSTVPRAWARKPVDPNKEYSLEDGRRFLPEVAGCSLQLDEARFTRWCGLYPRNIPPRHVTKSYGPRTGLSFKQALFHVLEQLWTWHEEETQQPCPWDFASVL